MIGNGIKSGFVAYKVRVRYQRGQQWVMGKRRVN